jgi:hypothetical protein
VGVAFRLKPTTVLRGGFGRFTQSAGIKGGQNGFNRSTPLITSLDNNLTPYDTLANPFHSGILEPTGSSLGPLTNLGQGVSWDNQNPGHPYSWEYSVHLQQEYKGWLFEVGYSHNKTYNIYWGLDRNLQPFDLWQSLHTPRFDDNGRPLDAGGDKAAGHAFAWDDQIPNPFKGLPGVTGALATANFRSIADLLRPIKILGGITENSNPWGRNQYDALPVKVERRFSRGFGLIAAYTWSRLLEDTSFWGPEISGPITEHKLGGEDRPHILSIAPIWEVPVGRDQRFFEDHAQSGRRPDRGMAALRDVEASVRHSDRHRVQLLLRREGFLPGPWRSDARSMVRYLTLHEVPRQIRRHLDLARLDGNTELPGRELQAYAGRHREQSEEWCLQ